MIVTRIWPRSHSTYRDTDNHLHISELCTLHVRDDITRIINLILSKILRIINSRDIKRCECQAFLHLHNLHIVHVRFV